MADDQPDPLLTERKTDIGVSIRFIRWFEFDVEESLRRDAFVWGKPLHQPWPLDPHAPVIPPVSE